MVIEEKKTAQEYRDEAVGHHRDREDSYDRCDTDGFLSQWASGIHSNLCSLKAELAENDWKAEFPGLFSIETGERVPAKLIEVYNRFKYCYNDVWALVDPTTAKFSGVFIPEGYKSTKQKRLGYFQKKETAPATAKIVGRGTGLSGSAWAAVVRDDRGW